MKEGIISFKFRSERDFDSIKFYGEAIALLDLKRMIDEKRISKPRSEGLRGPESANKKFKCFLPFLVNFFSS